MSKSTRLFASALRHAIWTMKLDGLTRQEIVNELRNLRIEGRCFARNEILRHFAGGC